MKLTEVNSNSPFLEQLLEIWQLVPCKLVDGVWVVLEEPKEPKYGSLADDWISEQYRTKLVNYQQAKERCLFEGGKSGFRIPEHKVFAVDNNIFSEEDTIRNLLEYVGREFTLTKTAEKQI